jgi:aspartate-semialdehyde dehydrogenase
VSSPLSDRSEGKRISDLWRLSDLQMDQELGTRTIVGTDPKAIAREGVQVVFSGLPSEVAGPVEDACADEGMAVFSNAASHRMDQDTPILIPEINSDHLASIEAQKLRRKKGGYVVTNANCSVTGLALGLKPLYDAFKFTDIGLHIRRSPAPGTRASRRSTSSGTSSPTSRARRRRWGSRAGRSSEDTPTGGSPTRR